MASIQHGDVTMSARTALALVPIAKRIIEGMWINVGKGYASPNSNFAMRYSKHMEADAPVAVRPSTSFWGLTTLTVMGLHIGEKLAAPIFTPGCVRRGFQRDSACCATIATWLVDSMVAAHMAGRICNAR